MGGNIIATVHVGELTRCNGFLQVLNGTFLAFEAAALLMVEPTKLLENLGMVGVAVKHTPVGIFGRFILCQPSARDSYLQVLPVIHLSAARTRDQSGTRCPLQSMAAEDH